MERGLYEFLFCFYHVCPVLATFPCFWYWSWWASIFSPPPEVARKLISMMILPKDVDCENKNTRGFILLGFLWRPKIMCSELWVLFHIWLILFDEPDAIAPCCECNLAAVFIELPQSSWPWPFQMNIWEGYKCLDALFTAVGGSRVWPIPSAALRKLKGATVASFISGDAHWKSPMVPFSKSPHLRPYHLHHYLSLPEPYGGCCRLAAFPFEESEADQVWGLWRLFSCVLCRFFSGRSLWKDGEAFGGAQHMWFPYD